METLGSAIADDSEQNKEKAAQNKESYQKLLFNLETQTKIHQVLDIILSTEDEDGELLDYIPAAIKILNCLTFYTQQISGFFLFFFILINKSNKLINNK